MPTGTWLATGITLKVWQLGIRHRLFCGVDLQQQRDNGMGIRGHRKLHPTRLGKPAIATDNAGYQFTNQFNQTTPIIQIEFPLLLLQRLYTQVVVAHALSHPGQVIPDQQIDHVLIIEIAA